MINLKTVISLERALDDEINPTCNVGVFRNRLIELYQKTKVPKNVFSKGGHLYL